jgi:phage baseplate assembly protein W
MHTGHPYRLSATRQLTQVQIEQHIADLVRVVLLTGPGERLHRPDFGAGLGTTTLFEPVDQAIRSVLEVRARGSLEAALGERIEIVALTIQGRDSTLEAELVYRLVPTSANRRILVTSGGGGQ